MKPPAASLMARLAQGPPLLMGILNRTPDSFSDGGEIHGEDRASLAAALERARALAAAGCELLDVGGESTRPGAATVEEAEELRRVLPLVKALAAEGLGWISIDTQRATVAEAALDAGAHLVNDISAGRRDPELWPLVAARGVPYVLMHMQGTPSTMQQAPRYTDVVAEVRAFLEEGRARLADLGHPPQALLWDPGIGFGKTLEHNLSLLARLSELGGGPPLLVGASRKSFIAALEQTHGRGEAQPGQRLGGSLAALFAALCGGARVLRVHDAVESGQALRLWMALAACRTRDTDGDPRHGSAGSSPGSPGEAMIPRAAQANPIRRTGDEDRGGPGSTDGLGQASGRSR
jgi:dihydropteroate synthase